MKIVAAALAGAALAIGGVTAKAAPPDVSACVTEVASPVKAIGGDRLANVTLAMSAQDDPESIKPPPGMIATLGKADLIICAGAGPEDNWLPAMLERAGNAKVAQASTLEGVNIAVTHWHSIYLLSRLGGNFAAAVEPEPGVAPGAAHLTEIITIAPKQKIRFVTYAAYEDPARSRYVTERAKAPLVKLPFSVAGTPEATDQFSIYKDSIDRRPDGLAGKERS